MEKQENSFENDVNKNETSSDPGCKYCQEFAFGCR